MNHENWGCPKCANREFESNEFLATDGPFAKIFDVQNKKFSTVSCTQCGYTELCSSMIFAELDICKTNGTLTKLFIATPLLNKQTGKVLPRYAA